MYPTHPASIRETLRGIHNGNSIVVALTCSAPAKSCELCVPPNCTEAATTITTTSIAPYCPQVTAEARLYDYDELLLNSKFAAIVPGEGTHSYRLYEALRAGSVPIIMGHSARPLPNLLPWDLFSVPVPVVNNATLLQLVDALSIADPSIVDQMQAMGKVVMENNFATLELQVRGHLHV